MKTCPNGVKWAAHYASHEDFEPHLAALCAAWDARHVVCAADGENKTECGFQTEKLMEEYLK